MQVPVELKIKYLERRIQEIDLLMKSLEENDFAPAMRLGHQVKGNAVTFDFPQMAPIGIEIENAAKIQNKEVIKTLVAKMSQEIQMAQTLFH